MKKRFILGLAALAALALTGCQKDLVVNQVPEETPIAFGTYLGRDAATKASVLDLESLATSGFGVFAHYTGTNDWGEETNQVYTTPNFMYNQLVSGTPSYTGESNSFSGVSSWTYSPAKYWPLDNTKKITFFAYAPHDSNTGQMNNQFIDLTANTVEGAPKVTYTLSSIISNHIDLVFANPVKNKTRTDDPVTFQFFHALSRVGFSVTPNDDIDNQNIATSTTIKIKELSISGKFYPSGILNLGESSGTSSEGTITSTPSWEMSDPSESKTFIVLNNGTSDDVSDITSTQSIGSNYLMILPQVFSNSGENSNGKLTISISYDVITNDSSLATPITISNTKSTEIEHTFVAGKAYNFNLKIGLNAIKFSASVEPWDTTHNGYNVDVSI